MKIIEGDHSKANTISAYRADCVVVNRVEYRESLLISPEVLKVGWLRSSLDALDAETLEEIVAHEPEVVLFGTGLRAQFLPASVREYFLSRRIGLEIMTTAAACRTYNLLVEDGRRVLAALIL